MQMKIVSYKEDMHSASDESSNSNMGMTGVLVTALDIYELRVKIFESVLIFKFTIKL